MMEADQASQTAMGTAFMRAYHSACDHPKIFDDFLAHRLLTEAERLDREERHLRAFRLFDPDGAATCPDRTSALACWMQSSAPPPIVLGRARYAEDLLEEAVRRQQAQQYVILGAGMDTFALRRPDLLARLKVFEVDHPATQADKRRRLREVGFEEPAQLHFLPVDFSRDDLAGALNRSAYDPQAPTFFSWLGVTYYLTRADLFATFAAIAEVAPAGSAVTFDYLDTDAFVPEKVAKRVEFMGVMVRRLGEPMITGLAPDTLAADLAAVGLRLVEDLGPDDIQNQFFAGRSDGYCACEHAHFAAAGVA